MSSTNPRHHGQEESVFTAPTVEEAVRSGLDRLGLDEGEAEVRVLRKGSRGFLGIGSREARVQLVPRTRIDPVVREMAEELLRRMGIPASVRSRQVGLTVEIGIESGENDGLLIGRKGETLDALQHLLTRMAGRRLGSRVQGIRVDVAGYRDRREEQLEKQVLELATRVKRTRRRAMTEPLSPAERRLVHRVLADRPGVRTHAGGSGINQRVIITPVGTRPRSG